MSIGSEKDLQQKSFDMDDTDSDTQSEINIDLSDNEKAREQAADDWWTSLEESLRRLGGHSAGTAHSDQYSADKRARKRC